MTKSFKAESTTSILENEKTKENDSPFFVDENGKAANIPNKNKLNGHVKKIPRKVIEKLLKHKTPMKSEIWKKKQIPKINKDIWAKSDQTKNSVDQNKLKLKKRLSLPIAGSSFNPSEKDYKEALVKASSLIKAKEAKKNKSNALR